MQKSKKNFLSNFMIFKILLFPGKFTYEMNEVWAPNTMEYFFEWRHP